MRQNHYFYKGKTLVLAALAACALGITSCDDVYDDDETWRSDVTNTTLTSPDVSKIIVTPSTDGSKMTITWPVVHGAEGYEVTLLDITDVTAPVPVDSINAKKVDGCEITASRTEDTNYSVAVRALGSAKFNNQDADSASVKTFTTAQPAFGTIPDGADLTQWFAENAIPADSVGMLLCYDLQPGGNYTMSGDIDFYNHRVALRTLSKTNHAKITLTGNARLRTSAGLEMKNLSFNCSASEDPLIELSETPDEAIKGATGNGDYYNIMSPITLNSCIIDSVNNNLVYDSNKKYCVGTMLITNCIVHLTSSSATNINGNAVIYFKAGYVNDLTIQSSTFYNTGDSDAKYFVQYNNSGRCDRGGYTSNSISYKNCTFYNVAKKGQWGNYNGFAGRPTSQWTMTNNIFVDCGNKQIARRFLGGRGNQSTATFANNTYMIDGEFESKDGSVESYDKSGTAIEQDPGFVNPSEGDFTVTGSAQLDKKTGDPRWLPASE